MLPRRLLHLGAIVLVALASPPARADGPAPAGDVTEPPGDDEFVVIPLRVHVLTATDLPEVDCRLTEADVERIVGKVNQIWHVAGVHFGLESVAREPAAQQERFRRLRDLAGTAPLGLFRILRPEASRSFDGLHVYYLHRFPVNGVYLGEDFALVQETARLRPVEGGIDEPIPRVTAHELGHALGLPHRQDRTNLLASGTTGTLLNADEVARARTKATQTRGAVAVADLRRRAEEASEEGDTARARRLWTWLSEIPGARAAEATRRLRALPE
ncbi:MAG TPA: Matrixin [Isosphaeraceae bacterium]